MIPERHQVKNYLFVDIDGFEDGNLDADLAQINKDSVSIGRNINFLKGLKKDVYIDEAINVIKDLQVNRVTMTDKTRYHQE